MAIYIFRARIERRDHEPVISFLTTADPDPYIAVVQLQETGAFDSVGAYRVTIDGPSTPAGGVRYRVNSRIRPGDPQRVGLRPAGDPEAAWEEYIMRVADTVSHTILREQVSPAELQENRRPRPPFERDYTPDDMEDIEGAEGGPEKE